MKTYLVTFYVRGGDNLPKRRCVPMNADSKVEALIKVVNMFSTVVFSVSSVERIKK